MTTNQEIESDEPESDEPDAVESEEPAPPRTVVLVNLLWLVPGLVGGSEESTTDALRDLSEDLPDDIDVHLAVLRPFVDAHPTSQIGSPSLSWIRTD